VIIYKYVLPIDKVFFDATLPCDAKILAFQVQNGEPVIWALVDTEALEEVRHFAIRGTGTAMNDWRSTDIYIGTVQIPPFVWHLFETKE